MYIKKTDNIDDAKVSMVQGHQCELPVLIKPFS